MIDNDAIKSLENKRIALINDSLPYLNVYVDVLDKLGSTSYVKGYYIRHFAIDNVRLLEIINKYPVYVTLIATCNDVVLIKVNLKIDVDHKVNSIINDDTNFVADDTISKLSVIANAYNDYLCTQEYNEEKELIADTKTLIDKLSGAYTINHSNYNYLYNAVFGK